MMIFIIGLIIIAVIIAVVFTSHPNETQQPEQLKLAYEQSLKGNSKKTALDAGRAYYSALRKDKALTIYDELAIANDLSAMNDHTTHF